MKRMDKDAKPAPTCRHCGGADPLLDDDDDWPFGFWENVLILIIAVIGLYTILAFIGWCVGLFLAEDTGTFISFWLSGWVNVWHTIKHIFV